MNLVIPSHKKVFFASDQHFGAPTKEASFPREQRFLKWLETIEEEAGALFLLGDLFDFWFEYATVVPKGFVRILGKLAQMKDKGLPIFFFVGNHDLWMNTYFQEELHIPIFHEPHVFTINGTAVFIGHGDGLGPGDYGYKRMKKVFTNPFSKWLFRWLHPDIGVKLAHYLSVKNKLISGEEDARFLGVDKEWLILYAQKKATETNCSFFVFGHRHLPMMVTLENGSKYVNLGDWIQYFTFGELQPETGVFLLKSFSEQGDRLPFDPKSKIGG